MKKINLVALFLSLQLGIMVSFSNAAQAAYIKTKAKFDDSVSMPDLVQQIEKSLIFSETSKPRTAKQANIVLDKSDYYSGKKSSEVEVLVVNQKNNQKIAEKQKLAYNSSLLGQYEVAIELYKQILKSEPNNQNVKFALATCYHNINQYDQAKNLYYDLLRSNAENKDQIVGNLLSLITDQSPNDAIYILSRLMAQNPKSSYITAQSAMAYDKIGKSDQAMALLNKAISLDPRTEYKYNLAIIYDKAGEYSKASELYQDVIASYDANQNNNGQTIPVEQVRRRLDFILDQIS